MIESRQTTACRLTGDTPSAICVIELNGVEASHWIERYWKPASGKSDFKINAIRYGEIRIDSSVGESVVVCRTDTHRYEIHCHGGSIAAQVILTRMVGDGILVQTDSQRCHESESDPIVAEAKLALLQARTVKTARILLQQHDGALSKAISAIDQAIAKNELAIALELVEKLRAWDHVGRHLIDPFEVLLCGPPNVGKSSLMNRILGYQRAIVHEQAGTTRDLLVEETSIEGWPVRLKDSAGIRASSDDIVQAGVARAVQASSAADLQLILVDPIEGWTDEHQRIFDRKPLQSLVVVTKSDLQIAKDSSNTEKAYLPEGSLIVSSVTGDGIQELLIAIAKRLIPCDPPDNQPILFSESQRQALEQRFSRVGRSTDD